MLGLHILDIEIYSNNQKEVKMLIIEENTLTHVDSVSDIIEHYGKKGMKWGCSEDVQTSVKT